MFKDEGCVIRKLSRHYFLIQNGNYRDFEKLNDISQKGVLCGEMSEMNLAERRIETWTLTILLILFSSVAHISQFIGTKEKQGISPHVHKLIRFFLFFSFSLTPI